jgi:hypothetical protein
MSETPVTPSRVRLTLPANVRLMLARLAKKVFRFQIARFPLLALIVLPSFWLLEALIDLVFNLSWGARLGFLVVSAALAGWLFYRHVLIPIRRRLSLRASALLVERKFPQFRTSLISAVDFTSDPNGVSDRSAPLVQMLLEQVGRVVDRTEILRGIVETRPLKRLLLAALGVLAVVGGLAWYFQPQSLVLARRVFLSRDGLPSRTTVEPLTADFTLDTGANVELAARAHGVIPRNGRLAVVYADGHGETIAVSGNPAEPGVFRITLRNVLQSFRYHFEINDGASPEFAVKTRALPTLTKTRFLYLPPSYTGRPLTELPPGSLSLLAGSRLVIEGESSQPLEVATLELQGLDQRIRMDNGDRVSNLRHRIESNEAKLKEQTAQLEKLAPGIASTRSDEEAAQKAMDEARKLAEAAPAGDEKRKLQWEVEKAGNALQEARGETERARSRSEQAKRELEGLQRETDDLKKQLEAAQKEPAPDKETAAKNKRIVRAEIPIPKEGLTGLSIHLASEDGVASEKDPVYRVNITTDMPPTVDITDPKSEKKTVLPGDKVVLKYRARDDYRIERLLLKYVILRPNAEGEAVPEGQETITLTFPKDATTVENDYIWDLGSFVPALTEGCSVNYWIEAADYYTLYSPGAGTSRKMILSIVSPEQKKAELVAEMEKAARDIERLSERQRKTNEKTDAKIRK